MGAASRPVPGPPGHILLVGFMTAGKTTVGRLLAARLDRPFVDLDAEVERAAGSSIPDIFETEGERAFRAWEARVTAALPDEGPLVMAVGGAWMCRPELRDRWPDAVRVWLRVSPREVLKRLRAEPAARPLLALESPVRRIQELLDERTSSYALAELHVHTERRSPEAIVETILASLPGAAPTSGPA